MRRLRKGMFIIYDGYLCRITKYEYNRVSLKAIFHNWSCGNIPLEETPLGVSKTNRQLIIALI